MDNPGSSIISAFGAGSGVDFVQLADQLSEATYAFQRSNLETRNQGLEARISSASLLRNALTQLSSALGDRVRTGELAPRANVSDPAIVDVSTTSGVVPRGSYSLEVSQLADSQLLISQAYTSGDDLVGEGTLRIRFGEVNGATFTEDAGQAALEIAVDASDTVQTLAAKISSASGGALQAYVAEGNGGAQLVIKGEDGASNGFVVEATSAALLPTATPGDLTYLAWDPATDAGQLRQSARDALYTLDTVEYSSPSNTVTDLPEGLSFDLKATNVGAPTTITFSNDTSAITDVMNDFLVALNDLAGLLAEEATPLGGTLGNDPGARELKRDLARLTNEVVMPGAAPGEPSTLADLGLKTTREGRFELDTERLNETLSNNPEAAAAMFTTGPFGLFATIDRLARDNTTRSDPGSLAGSVSRYEAQVERNSDKLDRIAEQQENLRERLTRDLVAAERRISASQSTLSFLEQQIEAWNGSN
ncbi:Flagellar hook-associated protein 2 [Erythrobacter sp. NAP1]|uniref:flagellar filament capping protein FliD n=1 Tax=Erythrobacter sp. NAP1 TaxID=237727 RepID=UPI000068776C|nr:flagellar filament capping protein FliD [Erythrobacter sp. NAP1]EAQ28907.1 Flagellar hook-associated protein 2 [Erythrobacter sp. NAP1]